MPSDSGMRNPCFSSAVRFARKKAWIEVVPVFSMPM